MSEEPVQPAELPRAPWSYRSEKNDDWGLVRCADGWPVASVSLNANTISRDLDGYRGANVDPSEKIGRLISASPAMYEALERIARGNPTCDTPEASAQWAQSIAQGALASADGEAR